MHIGDDENIESEFGSRIFVVAPNNVVIVKTVLEACVASRGAGRCTQG
jgi:hypothetical protein